MTATLDADTQDRLKTLSVDLAAARKAEAEAKAKRIQVEESIVSLLDPGDRSTITVDPGNGLKLTVKTDLSYNSEIEEIEKIDPGLVKSTTKKELDSKAYEELRDQKGRYSPMGGMPAIKAIELFGKVSNFVTVSPKKPAVTLKVA